VIEQQVIDAEWSEQAKVETEQLKVQPESVPGEGQRSSFGLNHNFSIYWAGQSLSAVGDAFAFVAMPLLVLEATGSVVQMGLVTATTGVSQILMGLIAGPLVDRLDRRKLMIGCDIGRFLLYSLIPLGWWLLGPQIWLIYLVTALASALGNLFGIASITAIPNLVSKAQIMDANSRLQATFGLAFFLGPMLSGFISYYLGGPVTAVGINAASYLASIFALSLVRLRGESQRREQAKESKLREISAGIRYLFSQPLLRSLTIFYMLTNMLTFAGLDLFIYRIKHDLGQGDNTVGIVLGVAAVGSILSALAVPLLRRRYGFGPTFIGGALLQAASLATIGLAPTVLLVLPATVGFTLGDRIQGVNSMTIRQEITPDRLLGRVTAAFWTLISVLGPIGAGVMTWLAAQFGSSPVLLAMGAGGFLLACLATLTPIRLRHPEQVYHKSSD